MSCEPYEYSRVRIIDIDGTILPRKDHYSYDDLATEPLPGAREQIREWWEAGDMIILWTARPAQYREETIKQLDKAGITYTQLVMDKPYSREIHIYDDKIIISHKVVPNVGIGGLDDKEKE